jgi:hypothetical protein
MQELLQIARLETAADDFPGQRGENDTLLMQKIRS